jgi:conjugative transfer pilus assembly protein TraH
MKLRRFLRSAVAIAASWSLLLSSHVAVAADLNTEVNNMFNSLGAATNVTSPGAFRGQAMSTYTGGSFFYRAPSRNYQFLRIDLPRFSGGCNGIDAYLGSWSHISGTQIRDMMQGIVTALPGVAFDAAIKSVSPLLGGIIEDFKNVAQMANNYNRNSCQMATWMANKAADAVDMNTGKACGYMASWFGLASDYQEGEEYCKTNRGAVDAQARSDPNPAVREAVRFAGNLTWAALQRISTIDDQTRELVMNMVGSTIYYADSDAAPAKPRTIDAKLDDLTPLLYGDAGTGPSTTIKLWSCNGDYANCAEPILIDQTYPRPMIETVRDLMMEVVTSIRTRTPLAATSPAFGLINTSSLPVYRMLSLDTNAQRGTSENLIGQYSSLIATDYAANLLRQFLGTGLNALSSTFDLAADQADRAKELTSNVRTLQMRLEAIQSRNQQTAQSMASVASSLEQLERNLRVNMPAYMRQMLSRDGQVR